MAKATVETIQPTPPPKKVILELSEDEAGFVFAACGSASGLPSSSIYDALYPLFVGYGDGYIEHINKTPNGRIPRLK